MAVSLYEIVFLHNRQYRVYINGIIGNENYFINMNRILLINETFLLLPNQSLSIEYRNLAYNSFHGLMFN